MQRASRHDLQPRPALVLRQDPDIVLVGEVRDPETAELALKASLTGHLVLTTLHTNCAVSRLTRLVDMGVEPFLVALVADRRGRAAAGPPALRRPALARTSRDPARCSRSGSTAADLARRDARCAATGCAECGGTGYRGRTGVFEVLAVDAALRRC